MSATQRRNPQTEAKRHEVVRLRSEGNSLRRVGEILDMTPRGVKWHEDAWLASTRPSAEQTEARRQLQVEAVDAVRARLFAALNDEAGEPRLEVVDRLDKLWAREAKLLALDLERNVTVNVFTAEQMYEALFAESQVVVEGVVVELEAPDAQA